MEIQEVIGADYHGMAFDEFSLPMRLPNIAQRSMAYDA